MKIKSISFENYKAFAQKQTMQLKPITLLIGKNSSGKSAIAKLFPLLENSLSGMIDEPLLLTNNGVELGATFRDLVYGKDAQPVHFNIEFANNDNLGVTIFENKNILQIKEWYLNDFKITYFADNSFRNYRGDAYSFVFKGFIPIMKGSDKPLPFVDPFFQQKYLIDVDYVGPFRMLPQRQFHLTGRINHQKTGIQGENAYHILGARKRLTHFGGSKEDALLENVSLWYQQNFDGWALKVNDNHPYIEMVLSKNGMDVNLVDVGQGMNQALPLVVRAHIRKSDSIIVLEQPELHLHPAAHGNLAALFAKSAKENHQTFVIETHSENFLLRLRKLIIENDFGFTKDDLVIYWIDEGEQGQDLKEITVSETGVLSDWPDGIFNEHVREILEMNKALQRKSKNKK
jgi:AAA15 family ATPase/GTPase